MGQKKVPIILVRCAYFRCSFMYTVLEKGLLERCPHFLERGSTDVWLRIVVLVVVVVGCVHGGLRVCAVGHR